MPGARCQGLVPHVCVGGNEEARPLPCPTLHLCPPSSPETKTAGFCRGPGAAPRVPTGVGDKDPSWFWRMDAGQLCGRTGQPVVGVGGKEERLGRDRASTPTQCPPSGAHPPLWPHAGQCWGDSALVHPSGVPRLGRQSYIDNSSPWGHSWGWRASAGVPNAGRGWVSSGGCIDSSLAPSTLPSPTKQSSISISFFFKHIFYLLILEKEGRERE